MSEPGSVWLQAQASCIGSALIDDKAAAALLKNGSRKMFSGAALVLFAAMGDLARQQIPIDPVTLNNQTGGRYQDWIMQAMEITPSAAVLDQYIQICREQAMLHGVREALNKAILSDSLDEMAEAVSAANTALVSGASAQEPRAMSELLLSWFDRRSAGVKLMPIGDPDLAKWLSIEPGDFVVIGADNSTGKTALALQLSTQQAKDLRVGFYSLETSQHKLIDRMIASESDVDISVVKRGSIEGRTAKKIAAAANNLYGSKLELIRAGGWTVDDIFRDAVGNRYDVIYIDYLQLIRSRDRDRYQAVTNISLQLHQMAQESGIVTVALSQLHRMDESKPPTKHDLRESGQIENDADIVLLLYKPSGSSATKVYNRVISIAKNKDGECGALKYHFDGPHMRFTKISEQHVNMPLDDFYAERRKLMRDAAAKATDPAQLDLLPDGEPIPFEK